MGSNQKKGLWIGGAILGSEYDGKVNNNVNDIKKSGFHDLFIWSGVNTNKKVPNETKYYLQIGTANCVYYDIASDEVTWNGNDQKVKTLTENINEILLNHTPVGTIKKVHIMIGGGSYYSGGRIHNNQTFVNLKALIEPSTDSEIAKVNKAKTGTGSGSIVYRMFEKLKENIPAICGVQYDDEYSRITSVNNPLSEMLIGDPFNYKLSYVPYTDIEFWKDCVIKFKDNLYGLYIQTYAASFSKWLKEMKKVDSNISNIIRPVLEAASSQEECPSQISSQMSDYAGLSGAGIWIYDPIRENQLKKDKSLCGKIISIKDYANAIEIPPK